MRATTVLIPTVAPSSTSTSASVPAAGEGISVSTLSVEISNNGSSRSTRSPALFSHLVRVPSTILSPIWGITTSVISNLSFLSREKGSLAQHFEIENAAKMRGYGARRLRHAGARAQLRHRSYGLVQAARHNVLEIAQIGADVQGETVRSHPPADVYANGGDLALIHPHAGQPGDASGEDAVIGQGIDNRLLDRPHVCAHVALPLPQVEDRVAHQLARAVVRHIAAAVDGVERNARARQRRIAGQQVLHAPVAPQRDHVGVFEQQELVRNAALLAGGHELPLQFERLAVIHAPEFPQLASTH